MKISLNHRIDLSELTNVSTGSTRRLCFDAHQRICGYFECLEVVSGMNSQIQIS
jgi:hypothetical protein